MPPNSTRRLSGDNSFHNLYAKRFRDHPDMSDLVARKTVAANAVTAFDMNLSLAKHFCHPVYGIVFEVAKATALGAGRHIDALAMGLWPSRGMELVAIEVKVSRADFRRELKQPEKAEELAQYCDRFYIAAPEGMIELSQLPPNWGLLERRDSGAIMETKPALRLDAKPVTRNLLAAVMRAANRPRSAEETNAAIAAIRQEHNEKLEAEVQRRLQYRHSDDARDAKHWRDFCAKMDERSWMDDAAIIEAVKFVKRTGVLNVHNGIGAVHKELLHLAERIEKAAPGIVPLPPVG